ncbi:sensor histidine kinase [Aquimarina rhabdastrellae]
MLNIKPLHHILFWFFVFLYVIELIEYDFEWPMAIALTLVEVLIYMTTFYINVHVLIPKFYQKKGSFFYILSALFLLGVIYLPYYYFEIGYYLIADNEWRILFSFSLNYTLFIIISFLYWYFILFKKQYENNLVLQNQKLQAELLLLKSQVSPHFLFNSLNNIYSLSIRKHENTSLMIEKLSDLLRYIIYEGQKKEVLLSREITLLKDYVKLELLKEPKAIQNIKVEISGVHSLHTIAPLMLINLVENCFKHSDITYNQNGFLKLQLSVTHHTMHFYTSNSYSQSYKNNEGGLGLQNIKQQLQHYYPNNHQITIKKGKNTFDVNLIIDL